MAENRITIKAEEEEDEPSKPASSTWRVVLFRAIREGNLSKVQEICERTPAAMHENFTRDMHDWELEWDAARWYIVFLAVKMVSAELTL